MADENEISKFWYREGTKRIWGLDQEYGVYVVIVSVHLAWRCENQKRHEDEDRI